MHKLRYIAKKIAFTLYHMVSSRADKTRAAQRVGNS